MGHLLTLSQRFIYAQREEFHENCQIWLMFEFLQMKMRKLKANSTRDKGDTTAFSNKSKGGEPMYAKMITAGIGLVSPAGTCTWVGRRPTGKCYGGTVPQSGEWGDCIAGIL